VGASHCTFAAASATADSRAVQRARVIFAVSVRECEWLGEELAMIFPRLEIRPEAEEQATEGEREKREMGGGGNEKALFFFFFSSFSSFSFFSSNSGGRGNWSTLYRERVRYVLFPAVQKATAKKGHCPGRCNTILASQSRLGRLLPGPWPCRPADYY